MATSKKNLPKMHFVDEYIQNPVHPISVTVIGAGGNGSQMLSALGRIHAALQGLGHLGLDVTVWDADRVEAPNIGRQLFSTNDIGVNKAVALVSRINRFYGTGWNAEDRFFPEYGDMGNITITCVDNVATRLMVGKMFQQQQTDMPKEFRNYYWLDIGNAQKTGQAILGSRDIEQPKTKKYSTVGKLPNVTQEFDLSQVNEKDSGPSCSLAEALRKQDLFINSTLVQLSGSLLWSLLTDMAIDIRGMYLNLDTMKVSPIKL